MNTHVDAPLEKVFAAFLDFPNAADRVEGINHVEMLTQGAVAMGTRFRETWTMFGRGATEEAEVTRFESDELFTLSAVSNLIQLVNSPRKTAQHPLIWKR